MSWQQKWLLAFRYQMIFTMIKQRLIKKLTYIISSLKNIYWNLKQCSAKFNSTIWQKEQFVLCFLYQNQFYDNLDDKFRSLAGEIQCFTKYQRMRYNFDIKQQTASLSFYEGVNLNLSLEDWCPMFPLFPLIPPPTIPTTTIAPYCVFSLFSL